MKLNNFNEDLRFSAAASCEEFWQKVYKKAFPDFAFAEITPGNSQGQKFGIDRVIYLNSGKTVYVDEKKRRKCWGDILLEYKSNSNGTANNGWMNKGLLIDFIAYAFMEDRKVYLLNWLFLRRAWLDNGIEWLRCAKEGIGGFKHVVANNGSYKTLSVAVPVDILLRELNQPIVISV